MHPIDWQEVAWDNDFNGNDKQMLIHLHHEKLLSIREISSLINISYESIRKRMRFHKLDMAKASTKAKTSSSPRPPRKGV
jgi:hypothetical protein